MKVCYYEFLGVEKTASDGEIKKAYYKQALQMHPDKNPNDPEAKEKFQQLNKIYRILGDPIRRKTYDQYGELSDEEEGFGEMAEEDETAEWTIPSLEELQRIFSTLQNVDIQSLVDSIQWKETLNPASEWSEKIVEQELQRASQAKISSLEFERRNIPSLPPAIALMAPFLTKLNLSKNKLKILPDEFLQLSKLSELDLSVNQLSKLPENFGQLSSLKKLWLEHNQLVQLPVSMGQLSHLIFLSLFANKLKSVPNELADCKNLRELDLELNYIDNLSPSFFRSNLKLKIDPSIKKSSNQSKNELKNELKNQSKNETEIKKKSKPKNETEIKKKSKPKNEIKKKLNSKNQIKKKLNSKEESKKKSKIE